MLAWTPPARPIDPPLDSGETWFCHVNVIPMDRRRILPDFTVEVKSGVIAQMGPSDHLKPSPGARQIDGKSDMYLLPGLADMHFHLYFKGDLLSLLANGVTTIRNMNGRPSDLASRGQIKKGEIPGPTSFTAGPILGGPVTGHLNVHSADEAVRIVRTQHEQGYDFVKVYDDLPKDALLATIKEAHRTGIQVTGHINTELRAEGVMAAGQDTLEHAEQFVYHHFDHSMDESEITSFALAVNRSGSYVCPTMELIHNYIELVDDRAGLMARPEIRFANPETIKYWAGISRTNAGFNRAIAYFQAKLVKGLADADVPLLSGTDTHLIGFVPVFSLHREFHCMADAGLTPYQILQSSTATPGRCLNRKVGQIVPGYQPDLLLIHRNPLSGVSNLKDREGVMARGKWYPQLQLDELMEDLVRSYAHQKSSDTSRKLFEEDLP